MRLRTWRIMRQARLRRQCFCNNLNKPSSHDSTAPQLNSRLPSPKNAPSPPLQHHRPQLSHSHARRPPPPPPVVLPPLPNITSPSHPPVCVPTFAPWQGPLLYTDCLTAWNDLTNQYAVIRATLFAFYTTSSGFVPPPGDHDMRWKLPLSITFRTTPALLPPQKTTTTPNSPTPGTCTLQIRMLRDFRPHELPLSSPPNTFTSPNEIPPAGISSWGSILGDAQPVLEDCVRRGAAGWTTNGFASAGGRVWAPVGILMRGVESEMAGRYKRRGRGLVRAGDGVGWGSSE